MFAALSDPTRRAMLARLALGPASVSELARPLPISLPSVVQHLRVLEDGGLVASRKTGRVRTFWIERRQFDAAQAWLDRQRAAWEARFDRMDDVVKELDDD